MLAKIFRFILGLPLALLTSIFGLFGVASTPTSMRQASARRTSAQAVARLLDVEEAKEVAKPAWTPPPPTLLPPQAALAWSWSLMTGFTPRPDLSSVTPSVASWIRSMTIDEARAMRKMSPREIADHLYCRHDAPGLRPMVHTPIEVTAATRVADGDYLDELLPALR